MEQPQGSAVGPELPGLWTDPTVCRLQFRKMRPSFINIYIYISNDFMQCRCAGSDPGRRPGALTDLQNDGGRPGRPRAAVAVVRRAGVRARRVVVDRGHEQRALRRQGPSGILDEEKKKAECSHNSWQSGAGCNWRGLKWCVALKRTKVRSMQKA